MNEKTSMNQACIKVKLFDNKGIDTLLFSIPDTNEGISVNLNDTSGQKDLKFVFEELLKILSNQDVELKLLVDDSYKKGLYKEVCTEYIAELNKEIKEVRKEIRLI